MNCVQLFKYRKKVYENVFAGLLPYTLQKREEEQRWVGFPSLRLTFLCVHSIRFSYSLKNSYKQNMEHEAVFVKNV